MLFIANKSKKEFYSKISRLYQQKEGYIQAGKEIDLEDEIQSKSSEI